ncbi:hypothetical protein HanRHA438_Chr17g0800991 [Helianthus annuus]|nr:hypothetical protein HanRHA438_Chr17g0800991 [Helianthus annuus]
MFLQYLLPLMIFFSNFGFCNILFGISKKKKRKKKKLTKHPYSKLLHNNRN